MDILRNVANKEGGGMREDISCPCCVVCLQMD